MKEWFSQKNLPVTLIVIGASLNFIDVVTGSAAAGGGRLYGTQGYLRSINNALPQIKVPGTAGLSSTYPDGLPLALGGYLVVIGAVWLLLRRL